MVFKFIQREKILVAGLSTEITKSQNENYLIIRKQWLKFNSYLRTNNIKLKKDWEKYGITYRSDKKFRYMTAIPFVNKSTGFENIEIPKGQFLCFQHKGSMNEIKNSVYKIYKQIIPENKLKIENNRNIMHYEFYDHRFNWNNKNSIIDIFLPVM